MLKKKTPITPEAAKMRMADLCARAEQCESDIRLKLLRTGIRAADADDILSYLKDNRFIDDSRYARSYARDKCRFSAWGKRKIRLGLMAKRISATEIDAALADIDPADYLQALRRVAAAKARTLDLIGAEAIDNRRKLYRHIISRGFEPSLASRATKEAIRNQQPEAES